MASLWRVWGYIAGCCVGCEFNRLESTAKCFVQQCSSSRFGSKGFGSFLLVRILRHMDTFCFEEGRRPYPRIRGFISILKNSIIPSNKPDIAAIRPTKTEGTRRSQRRPLPSLYLYVCRYLGLYLSKYIYIYTHTC